jgi:hypothetical protein
MVRSNGSGRFHNASGGSVRVLSSNRLHRSSGLLNSPCSHNELSNTPNQRHDTNLYFCWLFAIQHQQFTILLKSPIPNLNITNHIWSIAEPKPMPQPHLSILLTNVIRSRIPKIPPATLSPFSFSRFPILNLGCPGITICALI